MYLEYPSSHDPVIKLFADFLVPPEPRRVLVEMHGWHGQIKTTHTDNILDGPLDPGDWLVVRPEMRGRGDATGKPDCNGWELQDVIDAVECARREFAGSVLDPELITLTGGSGGGGNVLALLGKFPDTFCRARADCGISDYALWYRNDAVGEFRDEMEGAGWIGGDPDTRPEAYASRGGITTVANLLTPLILFHGDEDPRVPVEQSRNYVARAREAGKGHLITYHELKGVGHAILKGHITPGQEALRKRAIEAFLGDDPQPIHIPRSARFVVAGYLKTREFEVVLDSVDHVGSVEYDLEQGFYRITAPTAREALLRLRREDGTWKERHVETIRNPN